MSHYNVDRFDDSYGHSSKGSRSYRNGSQGSRSPRTGRGGPMTFTFPEPMQAVDRLNGDTDYEMPERRIASLIGRLTFGFSILATILYSVTFLAPGWAWTKETGRDISEGDFFSNIGLWYTCSVLASGGGKTYCVLMSDLPNIPVWIRVCQGISCGTLIFGVVTVICSGVYIFHFPWNRKPRAVAGVATLAIITGVCLVALLVLFCVQYLRDSMNCCPEEGHLILEYHLSYAFGMACVAAVFYLLTGTFAFVELYKLNQ